MAMINTRGPRIRAGALSGCLFALLAFGTDARAQDDLPADDTDLTETDETAPPSDEAEPEDATSADSPPPEAAATGGFASVERLSGEAYPSSPVRGIAGGSLYYNMHGLQWPYLPARGAAPEVRLGFSGFAWVDTSYQDVDSGLPETDPSLKAWRQQSRMVVRASPTYSRPDGWFVQGQGQMVMIGAAPTRTDQFIVADDLYVRIGKWKTFDVTAGRIQGWEVYHLGMGLDLNTVERDGARTDNNRPVDLYMLTHFWDYPNGPGRIAAHYYPTDYLRFELMGEVGGAGLNVLALRPVAILDLGVVKVKAGAEYGEQTPREQAADRKDKNERRGFGGSVQTVLEPYLEAGVSVAHSLVDVYNFQGVLDAGGSSTTTSYGGFVNVQAVDGLIFGAGANYTEEHNLKVDVTGTLNDERSHLQVFGAAQYFIWDQFLIKAVVAYANAHWNPLSDPPPIAEFRHKMTSGRLRLMYRY